MERHDYLFKLAFLGDSGVGKTCLSGRFTDNVFDREFLCNIAIEFATKSIVLDGKSIKLQIWDTAGQERFRSIGRSYFRGTHGFIVAYDITKQESFNNVKHWLHEIEEHSTESVNIVLVGNKCDLTTKRVVDYQTGREFADSIGTQFFEVSAKDATNVDEAFIRLVAEIKNHTAPNYKPNVKINHHSTDVNQGVCKC